MMSLGTSKVCFNSGCRGPSEKWWRGWRCRTGEYAHLCDRCAAAYEEGRFCETFHANAPGWRCCESCGKQVHCGCIVSFHMFVLLDAGGIECLTCTKKSYILTPNPAWPPPSHLVRPTPEAMKDLSVKTLSAFAGSGSVPWRQAPSLLNGSSKFLSDVQPRNPFKIDMPGGIPGIERLCAYERLSTSSPKQESSKEGFFNGKSAVNGNEQHLPGVNDFHGMFPRKDSFFKRLCLTSVSSKTEPNETQPAIYPTLLGKHVNYQNGVESLCETGILNGKAQYHMSRQLLPRCRALGGPHLISSDSKSVIIPMFEKMLSATDAGRVGRLVLPKKFAEAYFPPIDQPEGLPLQVYDSKGKEWVFQFRFWLNNNSRMYVLEGITPCIQSMGLQAGDLVTFSRMEPEGKLILGGKKASAAPSSDQVDECVIMEGHSYSRKQCGENKTAEADTENTAVEVHKSDEKPSGAKPIANRGRKNINLGVKNKRVKIESADMVKLKINWNEAQRLMRPPANIVPPVVLIEGFEFEEFEEAAPVIGRPAIRGIDHIGENIQWVQCEDCFKWRKIPANALLPSRWICSENKWDLDRSLCSADEEIAKEQLEDMLHAIKDASSKKGTTAHDPDSIPPGGLDALANIALHYGEGTPERTGHPKHKVNCACIVCVQAHSGPHSKSKHKESCDCIVCCSLKRRFKTLMERRGKKQLEKELIHTNPGKRDLTPQIVVSPLKGNIDLNVNVRPEREGESSQGPWLKHHRFLSSNVVQEVTERNIHQEKTLCSNFSNLMAGNWNNRKME